VLEVGHPALHTGPVCARFTLSSNEFSAKYDDRMPAIVEAGDHERWPDRATPTDKLLPLLG
jgi:putative SOS response-associated peptidase YedK